MNKIVLTIFTAMCMAISSAQAEITVNGTGSISLPPDMATISVGVNTSDIDPNAAMKENNSKISAIFDTLEKYDIDKECFKTTNFSIHPQYTHKSGEQSKLVGYLVSNSVQVKVHDLNKVGDVLGDVITDGANQVGSIQFGISKMSEALDVARNRATGDALRKANLYCEALDVGVGAVISITEKNVQQPRFEMYGAKRMSNTAERVPISAGGSQNVSVNVQVSFEVADSSEPQVRIREKGRFPTDLLRDRDQERRP